jgi:hypothetical protein
MDHHNRDNVALVFGLMFTTVGSVTLAELAELINFDLGLMVGIALVLAAVLAVVVTVGNLHDRAATADGAALSDRGGSPAEMSEAD